MNEHIATRVDLRRDDAQRIDDLELGLRRTLDRIDALIERVRHLEFIVEGDTR